MLEAISLCEYERKRFCFVYGSFKTLSLPIPIQQHFNPKACLLFPLQLILVQVTGTNTNIANIQQLLLVPQSETNMKHIQNKGL